MKKIILAVLFFAGSISVLPQWQTTWTSASYPYATVVGWLNFEKNGDEWKSRFYALDENTFKVMESEFSSTAQYTYTFTAEEKLAGYQLYSLGLDLTGDGKTEFYVLAYNGPSSNYRQSMKVFDIVANQTVFEKNDASFSYSYPTFADINNNGTIECLVSKVVYPSFTTYYKEVYSTTVTEAGDLIIPSRIELNQNYPNPFNPTTTITYELEAQQSVVLKIFDSQGELVNTLVSGIRDAGKHDAVWDGRNSSGTRVPTGVYFYELVNQQGSTAKKMLLLK